MSELKSFMMPVETVHDILSAVLKIFGNQDTSWNSMKKFIGTKGIIEAIINFDSRTLSKE
jgi:dynein heavy chain 2